MRCVGLWWLAFLSLASCGHSYDVGPFGRYLRVFKSQARLHGRSIPIEDLEIAFAEVPAGLQGYCTFATRPRFDWALQFDFVPVIHVKQDVWEADDEWAREALMAHELGHCLLGR